MKEFIFKIIMNSKNYKKIAWMFIAILLLIIVFYPIIDANFLYYERVSNRIEILEKVNKKDENAVKKNQKLENEYNAIIDEISEKENKYLNNIFIKETNKNNKIIKFFASSWLLWVTGIVLIITKDKKTGKRMKNILSGLIVFLFSYVIGYFGYIIPTIINVVVNVVLYQIIYIFLAYTISSFTKEKSENFSQK